MIAWLDLETSHSDERYGSVLEIGVVVTDSRLDVLDEWSALLSPRGGVGEFDVIPQQIHEMHRVSGLLADLYGALETLDPENGPPTAHQADVALSSWLDPYTSQGAMALGGSGVGHFDRRWLRRHLPATEARFHYWVYDVGVVRRFLRDFVDPAIIADPRTKAHRALPDARAHLDEWRFYSRLLGRCDEELVFAAADPHLLA